MTDEPRLYQQLRMLKPKSKQPNSATVLNNWITTIDQSDPFYRPENQARISAAIDRLEAGQGTVHELIDP